MNGGSTRPRTSVRAATQARSCTRPIAAITTVVQVMETTITGFRPTRSASQPPRESDRIETTE
jgi:hypothetical protein